MHDDFGPGGPPPRDAVDFIERGFFDHAIREMDRVSGHSTSTAEMDRMRTEALRQAREQRERDDEERER